LATKTDSNIYKNDVREVAMLFERTMSVTLGFEGFIFLGVISVWLYLILKSLKRIIVLLETGPSGSALVASEKKRAAETIEVDRPKVVVEPRQFGWRGNRNLILVGLAFLVVYLIAYLMGLKTP
jgi:hypothetical protein